MKGAISRPVDPFGWYDYQTISDDYKIRSRAHPPLSTSIIDETHFTPYTNITQMNQVINTFQRRNVPN